MPPLYLHANWALSLEDPGLVSFPAPHPRYIHNPFAPKQTNRDTFLINIPSPQGLFILIIGWSDHEIIFHIIYIKKYLSQTIVQIAIFIFTKFRLKS